MKYEYKDIFGEVVYKQSDSPVMKEKLKADAKKIVDRISKYPETPAEAISRLATMKEPKWRVPGPTGLMGTFALHDSGIDLLEACYDPDRLVAAQFHVCESLEHEFPQADYDVYNIEAEALGCKLLRSPTNYASVAPGGEIIKEKEDLDKLRVPDFETEGRGSYFRGIMENYFETAKGVVTPFYFHITPWDMAFKTMPWIKLLKWARKDPEFMWRALDFFGEIAKEYGKFQYEEVVKPHAPTLLPFMWAAACDIPLIGLKNWEEYAMPAAMKVIKQIPYDSWGVFRFYEAVDDWKALWKRYMENSGPIVFMYGMDTRVADLAEAKKITRDHGKFFVVGTDAETINYSAMEILDGRLRRHIRDTAPGGGSIPVKLDTVSPACSRGRFEYMIKKVKEYGTYPIDVEGLQDTESTGSIQKGRSVF